MTNAAYRQTIVTTEPPPLRDVAPHITQALAARVEKALARTPADRYQTPAEFDAALGSLPRVAWSWQRTDEHAAHEACWRGSCAGRADLTTCVVAVSGGRTQHYDVVTQTAATGRMVHRSCRTGLTGRQVPRAVRTAIAAA